MMVVLAESGYSFAKILVQKPIEDIAEIDLDIENLRELNTPYVVFSTVSYFRF